MLKAYDGWRFGLVLLVTIGASGTAKAQTWVDRCGLDATSSDEVARKRLTWMRICALKPLNPRSDALATALDCRGSSGLEKCKEYRESIRAIPTENSYTGTMSSARKVNESYYNFYYKPDIGSIPDQAQDDDGYWIWKLPDSFKHRGVFYPTYGDNPDWKTGNVYAPDPDALPTSPTYCNMYKKRADHSLDFSATISTWYFQGTCQAGCYTPEQLVRFESGYEQIGTATENLLKTVVTLDPRATIDNIFFMNQLVDKYIRSSQAEETQIYDIQTTSGGQLRVTANHPLVRSDGVMVTAESLHRGVALLREDGSPDPIVSISVNNVFGKVYNLQPVSRNRVANILVAQGFLSGSSAYQNEDIEYINRLVLRRTIPIYVIPH